MLILSSLVVRRVFEHRAGEAAVPPQHRGLVAAHYIRTENQPARRDGLKLACVLLRCWGEWLTRSSGRMHTALQELSDEPIACLSSYDSLFIPLVLLPRFFF
jgi:hypothetical protein